jgi:hypothetical protein
LLQLLLVLDTSLALFGWDTNGNDDRQMIFLQTSITVRVHLAGSTDDLVLDRCHGRFVVVYCVESLAPVLHIIFLLSTGLAFRVLFLEVRSLAVL